MNTTYAGVSESSATNYLFLFAQRTLALQNTPPTPPPLNVVGLPCEAICLLWEWLRLYNAPLQPVAEAKQLKKKKAEAEEAAEAEATQLKVTRKNSRQAVAEELEGSEELKAAEELKAVMARSTADKLRSSTGSWSFSTGSWSFTGSVSSKEAKQGEENLFIEEEAVEEEAAAAAAAERRSSAQDLVAHDFVGRRVLRRGEARGDCGETPRSSARVRAPLPRVLRRRRRRRRRRSGQRSGRRRSGRRRRGWPRRPSLTRSSRRRPARLTSRGSPSRSSARQARRVSSTLRLRTPCSTGSWGRSSRGSSGATGARHLILILTQY